MKTLLTVTLAVVFALANSPAKAADLQNPVVLKGHTSRVLTVVWADDGKSFVQNKNTGARIAFSSLRDSPETRRTSA